MCFHVLGVDFERALEFSAAFQSQLQAIARKDGSEVIDDVEFVYQTEKWGAPAKFVVEELGHTRDVRLIEARLVGAKGVQCLDARHAVRFDVAGDGQLVQNLGIVKGSRKVELCDGRSWARVGRQGAKPR